MNIFRIEMIFILSILLGCESELEIDSNLNDNQLTEVPENEVSISNLNYDELIAHNSSIDLEKVCSDIIIKTDVNTEVSGKRDCSNKEAVVCTIENQTDCKISESESVLKVVDSSKVFESMVVKNFTIAGVTGNQEPAPDSCSADGQSDCVNTGIYKAANTTNIAAKILTGNSVAGISGIYTPDFPSANNVRSIDTVDGVSGNLADCSYDGEISCNTSLSFKSANMANATAGNIKTGITIGGVNGTYGGGALSDCATDGEIGCKAVSAFRAVDMVNVTSDKIRFGVTIASIAGGYPSATYPLTGASVTDDLNSSVFNTSLSSTASFEYWTSAGVRQTGTGDADLTAVNVKDSISMFGVTGTATVPPSDCSSDGETGCVTVTAFKAADMTNVTAGAVKSGTTIAGVSGDYPSSTYPLTGASATTDLISSGFNSALTSATAFEYWTSAGVRHTGAGDIDLAASNIKNSISLFGVTGSLTESPVNCSSDSETGCVAVTAFKAADMSNVTAGNIKSGSTIAGVSGDYPSSTFPLTGASVTADLDTATFNAKMKISSVFEYWNSSGDKQTGSGDDDISEPNLKTDVNIFGTIGTFAGIGSGSLTTPTGFSAVDIGSSQIDLAWDNVNAIGYLLIVNQGGAVTFTPVDGTGYSTGTQTGGDIVYTGSTNSFSQTSGITTGNVYHYALYSYDSDNNYSSVANTIEYARYNCGGAGDNCYDDASAKLLGYGITPSGKNLEYVFANGTDGFQVWKESEGDRILRANGLDEWAKKLNLGGNSFISADFTDSALSSIYTLLGGRSCPDNVYIDDSNKFTTDNCVYYTQAYPGQALNEDGYSQASAFSMGLSSWSSYNSGNPKWYTGNIKTCSDKGMRLPTIYETNTTRTSDAYYPTADGSPVFNITNAIPLSETIWTSSSYTDSSYNYWYSNGGVTTSYNQYVNDFMVICILP